MDLSTDDKSVYTIGFPFSPTHNLCRENDASFEDWEMLVIDEKFQMLDWETLAIFTLGTPMSCTTTFLAADVIL